MVGVSWVGRERRLRDKGLGVRWIYGRRVKEMSGALRGEEMQIRQGKIKRHRVSRWS